jgi:hypothetical protein
VNVSALSPGLHPDIPDADYHQRELGVASNTALAKFARAPLAYRTWVDGKDEAPTPAQHFGKALHCAVFEPHRFDTDFAIAPRFGNCSHKGPKEERDRWRKAHEGQTWIDADDGDQIAGMVRVLWSHRIVARLLAAGGQSELTVRWDDPDTGVTCKLRLDRYIEDLAAVIDLKSTDDATERRFRRSIAEFGYDRQDAFYRDGMAAVGKDVDTFVFIAIEKEPPHLVGLYSVDPEGQRDAREKNRTLLRQFRLCLEADRWPGLSENIVSVAVPRWA